MKRIREERKLANGKLVEAFEIAGCDVVIVRAWEKTDLAKHEHSTISTFNNEWYGTISSRSLSPEINSLPVGSGRSELVSTHHKQCNQLSRMICNKAFMSLSSSSYFGYWRDNEYVLTKKQFEEISK